MDENCATKYFFKYFKELELEGGLIRAGGCLLYTSISTIISKIGGWEMNKNFQQAFNEVFSLKKGKKNPDITTEEEKDKEDLTENISPAPADEKYEPSQEIKSSKGPLFGKK